MEDILKRLAEQEVKLDAIWRSVERTRKYFMWTLIITVLAIVLPMIGLIFAIPALIRSLDFTSLGL
jgi:CHASE3 domain sensor protein